MSHDNLMIMKWFRLENAVRCPGNNVDHNPALLVGMTRSDIEERLIGLDTDETEYATDEQMDAYYEANYGQ